MGTEDGGFFFFFKCILSSLFKKIDLFLVFLTVLGLHFCEGLSLVAVSGGFSLVVVHKLLVVRASLIVEHRLQGPRASAAVAHGLRAQAR